MTTSLRAHYGRTMEKQRLKRLVFKPFLKTVSDGADVTFCGRAFDSQEATTGKDIIFYFRILTLTLFRSLSVCHNSSPMS